MSRLSLASISPGCQRTRGDRHLPTASWRADVLMALRVAAKRATRRHLLSVDCTRERERRIWTPRTSSIQSLSVCLLFVLSSLAAYAQSASTGALTGTVTDPTGAVLRNAQIALRNIGTGETRGAITDQGGSYHLSLLPPGKYELTVEATGFAPLVVREVLIRITEVTSLATQLAIKGLRERKVRQLSRIASQIRTRDAARPRSGRRRRSQRPRELECLIDVAQPFEGPAGAHRP